MRTVETIRVLHEVVTRVVCNKCGKEVSDDAFKCENYLSVKYTGGYDSLLGDMTTFCFDLCESCMKLIFSEFAVEPEIEEVW